MLYHRITTCWRSVRISKQALTNKHDGWCMDATKACRMPTCMSEWRCERRCIMSRIANISPISSNKLWMVITGLAMLYFAVLASGVKRPYSQIQPQAESEKSQALRASIAKLTETRDEALESNEDTRLNLEALQAKYTENAEELKKIKRQINLVRPIQLLIQCLHCTADCMHGFSPSHVAPLAPCWISCL